MEPLPVWELALIIFAPMLAALLIRRPLEKRFVDTAPFIGQSTRQFRLDLLLFLAAGIGCALILGVGLGFPLVLSGGKLALGVFTVGVFAALDLSLARERMVIQAVSASNVSHPPPRELSPMTRRFSLVGTLIVLLITGVILLVLIRDVYWLAEQDLTVDTVKSLGRAVLVEVLFVMGFLLVMVINLVFSYARNLRILFNNETEVLESVSQGDFTRKVPVATSDEMGVIAGHTNTMIKALREGVRMREGLQIAMEVQQNFLPDAAPSVPGLDIAGSAHFSDETGGDFYDFIECERAGCTSLAIAVGDVSGHGIGAALLMASTRALVRQNALQPGAPAQDIARVNNGLAHDLAETGRFITLLYMVLEPEAGRASWVNAGHQPPLVYDPVTDVVTELRGGDIPLGVEGGWQFTDHQTVLPRSGQIMLLGTDGLWEAQDTHGEMFGPQRIEAVLRAHHDRPAREILEALVAAAREFCGHKRQEDDLTLVLVKGVAD